MSSDLAETGASDDDLAEAGAGDETVGSAGGRTDASRESRHRRLVIIVLTLLLTAFLAVGMIFQRSQVANVSVHTITAVNIILLLVLLFVLGRNVIKLYVERRQQKLGSQFSTRVVVTYIGMALVPTVLLFIAASNLIRTSVDRWFSTTTTDVVDRAREVARESVELQEDELLTAAQHVAREVSEGKVLSRDSWEFLRDRVLRPRLGQLQLDAVSVYQGDKLLLEPLVQPETRLAGLLASRAAADPGAASSGPGPTAEEPVAPLPEDHPLWLPPAQLAMALQGQPFRLQDRLDDGSLLIRAGAPVAASNDSQTVEGVIVTARILPAGLMAEVDTIESLYATYVQDVAQKDPIKTTYLLTFLLMTLLILFSALWVGLYLARGVTVPIQKLAEGTRAVASGKLDHRVEVEARDELGMLVQSFNQMTVDLRAGQEKLQHSRDTLQRANTELEERRRYMEAVLANIATGVISLNGEGQITTFNRAAERMLSMDGNEAVSRPYGDVFDTADLAELRELMDRAKARRGPVEQELSIDVEGSRLTISAHCSSLRDSAGSYLGTVVVLDDLTDLIKAQKASAWREVARRIAHEIRNPLTPIQLSAQRIARRYRRAAGAEGQYDVIEEGTRTILQEVDTLKGLVSEFSRYARMPTVNVGPANLHDIIDNSLLSCVSMHEGIEVVRDFSAGMPAFKGDPEQLKRAFTNLFDNAVEAMEGRGTLAVRTAFDPEVEMLRVEVADSGPGIRAEDKDKLFLPYFSRKRDGTGLGLAIVHQIVSDHRGYVRVADNRPCGTVFIIELPR